MRVRAFVREGVRASACVCWGAFVGSSVNVSVCAVCWGALTIMARTAAAACTPPPSLLPPLLLLRALDTHTIHRYTVNSRHLVDGCRSVVDTGFAQVRRRP